MAEQGNSQKVLSNFMVGSQLIGQVTRNAHIFLFKALLKVRRSLQLTLSLPIKTCPLLPLSAYVLILRSVGSEFHEKILSEVCLNIYNRSKKQTTFSGQKRWWIKGEYMQICCFV